MEGIADKNSRVVDDIQRQMPIPETDKEKRNVTMGKSMNAWKEKRNWEENSRLVDDIQKCVILIVSVVFSIFLVIVH